METGEFHLEQGICFKRMDDNGSVRIRKYKQPIPNDETPEIEFECTVDDSSWASVVASVSARDEDADTWQEALDYHNE